MSSKPADGNRGKTGQDDAAARERDAGAEPDDEALNDARSLQQMSEGVADANEQFRRIERKHDD
jgi:hypothetical protein